jgi:selenocysteine lyase/cysteine desulfurase
MQPGAGYFDHAATSFPKAPGVAAAAARFLEQDAGNAGRGVHALAQRAADAIEACRLALARLLGIGDASRLALLPGATLGLNAALHGVLRDGDRVLVGPDAHNSILRPLWLLAEARSVESCEVHTDDALRWDLAHLEARLREESTALVVVSHASNVTGAVQDLTAIVELAHAHGARVLVDAAQTAGALPLAVGQADLLAFSGHKSLLGPTGTGGLYVRPGLELAPWLAGGTGTRSEEEVPTAAWPQAVEVGTPNAMAFAALKVAVDHVTRCTPAAIHAHAAALGARLRAGLAEVPNLELFAADGDDDLPVVSFRLPGWSPAELAVALDAAGFAVRPGVHCAPRAHRRLGTLPEGTVRASVGPSLDEASVDGLVAAVASLA